MEEHVATHELAFRAGSRDGLELLGRGVGEEVGSSQGVGVIGHAGLDRTTLGIRA